MQLLQYKLYLRHTQSSGSSSHPVTTCDSIYLLLSASDISATQEVTALLQLIVEGKPWVRDLGGWLQASTTGSSAHTSLLNKGLAQKQVECRARFCA